MYVKAKVTFNHGGFFKMNYGQYKEVTDELGKTLLSLDLVEENRPSHKKMKIKKKNA